MFQDVGAGVHVVDALETSTVIIVNGATGNQDSQTGFAVDLTSLPRKYNSVKVVVVGEQLLATARTLAFKTDMQDRSATSGAGSTWANFGTTGRTFTLTTSGTGRFLSQVAQEGEGVFRTARKFLRIVLAPTSAGGDWIDTTATAADSSFRVKAGLFIFGTPDEMPASG